MRHTLLYSYPVGLPGDTTWPVYCKGAEDAGLLSRDPGVPSIPYNSGCADNANEEMRGEGEYGINGKEKKMENKV